MKIVAVCDTCRHQHGIEFDPVLGPGAAFSDWLTKHGGHDVDFVYPRRSGKDHAVPHRYMDYIHNADIKIAYATTVPNSTFALTLASLAASSTLLGGRESTAIDNGASNKYLDTYIAGHYKQAATNTAVGLIRTAIVGAESDTPTWPDVFDGTDSAETVTTQAMYDSVCRIASEIVTAATANAVNPFGPVAIGSLFGGVLPDQYVLFVSQSAQTSTNAWSATEGDHAVYLTPVYATVI